MALQKIRKNNLLDENSETIVALATPRGVGAIAIIRLSGENVKKIVDSFSRLSSGKKIEVVKSHTVHHGYVFDSEEKLIDEVLFVCMWAPRSYTGQDTIEINCHNNSLIIERIINQAIHAGARLAKGGEFTRRAVLNGKMDLLQAEAVNDLIAAQTEEKLDLLKKHLQGSLSFVVKEIENDLVLLLSYVESMFEFFEEEERDLGIEELILEKFYAIQERVADLVDDSSRAKFFDKGMKISIMGLPNVGKSTLFNSLLKEECAIVTNIPGTTRDVVQGRWFCENQRYTLLDTAGLRKSSNIIEKIGIQKGLKITNDADIILFVVDPLQPLKNLKDKVSWLKNQRDRFIWVVNKIDLLPQDKLSQFVRKLEKILLIKEKIVFVSAKNKKGISELEDAIKQKKRAIFMLGTSNFLLNDRHMKIIISLKKILAEVKDLLLKKEYEIVAIRIRDSLSLLSDLTGKTISDRILKSIFENFCVGK